MSYPVCASTHPPAFWRSIVTGDPYRMRAAWIVGSNPLCTMTHSLEIEEALRSCSSSRWSRTSSSLPPPSWRTWCCRRPPGWSRTTWSTCTRSGACWPGVRWRRWGRPGRPGGHHSSWPTASAWTRRSPGATGEPTLNGSWRTPVLSFEQFCELGILTGQMRYHKYRGRGFSLTPSGRSSRYTAPC